MGVQSTAMYMMSCKRIIERADHAVFADPGAELPRTYEMLEYLQDWASLNDGIPIHVTNERNILKDILNKTNSTGQQWITIPAFSEYSGMIRRQCTSEYKIKPVMKKVRELHGLKKYQRMPKTEMWLGISMDEIQRMKVSRLPNVEYIYPLIDQRMTRGDCLKIFERFNFPLPPKSACVFCPYQPDRQWKDLKDNYPNEFKIALNVDKTIRDSSKKGESHEKIFLHKSCTPLERVQFADQQDLFMCEEGFCGL